MEEQNQPTATPEKWKGPRRSRASVALQKAARLMIPDTEAFGNRSQDGRQPMRLSKQSDWVAVPSRQASGASSSGDPFSPVSLVDCDLATKATVKMVTVHDHSKPGKQLTGTRKYYPWRAAVEDPALQTPKEPVVQNEDQTSTSKHLAVPGGSDHDDITSSLRLASPVLPPRLLTPTTPLEGYPNLPFRSQHLENLGIIVGQVSDVEEIVGSPTEIKAVDPSDDSEVPSKGDRRRATVPQPADEIYSDLEVVTPDMLPGPLRVEHNLLKSDSLVQAQPLYEGQQYEIPLVFKESTQHGVDVERQAFEPEQSWKATCPLIMVICSVNVLVGASFAQALVTSDYSPSGTHPDDVAWFTAAFALLAGVSALPASRLATIVGQKVVFIDGLVWLAVWSILAGISDQVEKNGGATLAYLCFCRAMHGMAIAFLIPAGYGLLQTWGCLTRMRTAIIMMLYFISAILGFVLGAIVSTALAKANAWIWSFFSVGFMAVILGAFSLMILPRSPRSNLEATTSTSIWIRMDCVGCLVGTTSLILFNVGWNQVPNVSLNTPYTYFFMIIGAMLFIAFLYLECRVPKPLLPVRSFTVLSSVALAFVAAEAVASGVWLWYILRSLIKLWGWHPLPCSTALIPVGVSGLAGITITSYALNQKRDMASILSLIAAVGIFIGSTIVATAPADQTYWQSPLFSAILVSFGSSMAFPSAMVLVGQTMTGIDELGPDMAASLVFAVAMYSFSTALGMAGSVEAGVGGQGKADALKGVRAAQDFGLGVCGLGVLLAVALVVMDVRRRR